jgi:hypothetical protein
VTRRSGFLLALAVGLAAPRSAEGAPNDDEPARASGAPTPTPPQGGAGNGGEQRAERSPGSLARAEGKEKESAATAVSQARRAVEEQRYDEALALLAPDLSSPSRSVRAEALQIAAVVRLLVGEAARGAETVATLYELAPAFRLDDPSLPPRVTDVFEAEAARPHARSVTLAIRPSATERGVFDLSAPEPASRIDLACSPGASPSFAPVTVTRERGGFSFRLPLIAPHRCHALARDADGLPVGRLGSASRPVNLAPPPATTPLVKQWWLWTSVGVAVAAVAVGAAVAAKETSSRPPAADLTLRPQRAIFAW